MATHDIFMPALSSTMTEGKIVEWLKQPGDKVGRGESVLVVESDKADMDVESYEEGYLAAILTPEGDSAAVGAPVGLLAANEADIAKVAAAGPQGAGGAPAAAAAPAAAPAASSSSSSSSASGETPRPPKNPATTKGGAPSSSELRPTWRRRGSSELQAPGD